MTNEDFLPILVEQLKEVRRDITEIRTAQAAQPTRADLTAYVLKEVFEVEVRNLREKDEKQQKQIEGKQDQIDELREKVMSQALHWLQVAGIIIGTCSGAFALIKMIFFP